MTLRFMDLTPGDHFYFKNKRWTKIVAKETEQNAQRYGGGTLGKFSNSTAILPDKGKEKSKCVSEGINSGTTLNGYSIQELDTLQFKSGLKQETQKLAVDINRLDGGQAIVITPELLEKQIRKQGEKVGKPSGKKETLEEAGKRTIVYYRNCVSQLIKKKMIDEDTKVKQLQDENVAIYVE